MKTITISHKGKRKSNQDAILVKSLNTDNHIYLIADGMGGYDNGDIAANMAIESISTFLATIENSTEDIIQKGVNKANLAIRQYQDLHQSKMGATIAGVIINNNKAKLFWVGDVKIMVFKKFKLKFESKSHNLINEMSEMGSMSSPDKLSKYAHIVTRSIQGNVEKSKIEYIEFDFSSKDDLIIICSDGVHNVIDSKTMEFILNQDTEINLAIEKIKQRIELEATDNSSLIAITI